MKTLKAILAGLLILVVASPAMALTYGDVQVKNNLTLGVDAKSPWLYFDVYGQKITQKKNSGYGWYIYRNLAAANTTQPLAYIFQDNAGDDQVALAVTNDGTGAAIKIAAATGADIELQEAETIDNLVNGTVNVTTSVFKHTLDSNDNWTATKANGGVTTFNDTTSGTAGFVFSDPVEVTGLLTSYSGSVVLSKYARVPVADINAGNATAVLLPAVVGRSYRVVGCKVKAVGGAVGTGGFSLKGYYSAAEVDLLTFAQANLTENTYLQEGDTGVTATATACMSLDSNKAIRVLKTAGDLDTATAVDIVLQYVVE